MSLFYLLPILTDFLKFRSLIPPPPPFNAPVHFRNLTLCHTISISHSLTKYLKTSDVRIGKASPTFYIEKVELSKFLFMKGKKKV